MSGSDGLAGKRRPFPPILRFARQWLKNRSGGTVLPLELILFVTGRCTFRCGHCFIENFETDPSRDLPLQTIERLAADLPDLMVLMLTGGEPFLRKDLAEVVRAFSESSGPMVISIGTNGFLTGLAVETVGKILEDPRFRSRLVLSISFEGIGSRHDENRGRQGAYEAALETARELKRTFAGRPPLSLGANLTMTPRNQAEILQAARSLSSMGLFDFISQNILRNGKPCQPTREIDPQRYRELSRFAIEQSRFMGSPAGGLLERWGFHKEKRQASLIEGSCRTGSYQGLPCEAGRGIGVVYSQGTVAPCELYPPTWGDIRERSFREIWNDRGNREAFRAMRAARCFCTHECFIGASLNLQPTRMLSWKRGAP